MSETDLVVFLAQIGVLLCAALIGGAITARLRLPVVVGELAAGIVVGPTVFGALAPGLYAWLVPPSGPVALARDALLKLGLLLFLFVAGLHVRLRTVSERKWGIASTSALGIAVPFALGAAGIWLFPQLWGPQPQSDLLFPVLFMGTALSISALPVIARVLIDIGLIKHELGLVVMAAATIDDLIGWVLFALLVSAFASGAAAAVSLSSLLLAAGLVVAVLAGGHFAGKRALEWTQRLLPGPVGFIGVTSALVILVGAATEALGIHSFLGAFLVGVALAEHADMLPEARHVIQQFAMSFFAPLYFVALGLQANFITGFDLPLVALVLVVACVGKVAGAGLGAWLGGLPPRSALAVGFGMNARGAMGMILASVALQYGLIDQRMFVALVLMALVTSLLSGPAMRRLLQLPSTQAKQAAPNEGETPAEPVSAAL